MEEVSSKIYSAQESLQQGQVQAKAVTDAQTAAQQQQPQQVQ